MHRIGDIIDDRYQLTRPLGMRQGAEMWEAEHQLTGRKATLKLIPGQIERDPAVRKRVVAEARMAAEIGHPNVVEVYDVGVTPEGIGYLVTERLLGETLADLVARHGAMQTEDACQVALQVLAGLEAAHAAGIEHGALRPDSVILRRSRDGQLIVKLLDFGAAAPLPSGAKAESMSRVSGRANVEADVHAVGAMLYEMLSGRAG
ncbi:MAG TPA: serine/threonine-protein kinase, partial [Polyangiaceae bacterium]|nr:serine/threonine-protein kinase [Polyangiaceae bacterium]